MSSVNPRYLSILIVNWNSKDYLRRCLYTCRDTCRDLNPQVVVVDAGSFDGSEEMIKQEFPEVEFVQSQENGGFARSNNLGFEKVAGEYLLLLNPDTELRPYAIDNMLAVFKEFPDAGIIGPRILNSDGSLQTSCVQALPTPLNQAMDTEFLRKLLPKSELWGTWKAFTAKEPVEVPAVSGACMLLRSDTFKKVGGFSSEYFIYAEDMDLCFKVKRTGLRIYHAPQAVIVHHGGGSSRNKPNSFSIVSMHESTYIYMLKNHGRYKAELYRWLQGLSATIRLGIMLPSFVFLKDYQSMSLRYSFQKWKIILRWALKNDSV